MGLIHDSNRYSVQTQLKWRVKHSRCQRLSLYLLLFCIFLQCLWSSPVYSGLVCSIYRCSCIIDYNFFCFYFFVCCIFVCRCYNVILPHHFYSFFFEICVLLLLLLFLFLLLFYILFCIYLFWFFFLLVFLFSIRMLYGWISAVSLLATTINLNNFASLVLSSSSFLCYVYDWLCMYYKIWKKISHILIVK